MLDPLIERPLYLPNEKALLSRDGGVCPADGSRLAFDPLHPHEHRCIRCGRVVSGELHHRSWIRHYHLWISERAIHLALLGALEGDTRLSARAADVLTAYAALYPTVPNRDNVLGPSRLFFSTYLESLWLAQLVTAAAITEGAVPAVRATLEPVVVESAALVASFDEGASNRQVWNDAALIAAGTWLADEALVNLGLEGPHGLRALLRHGVTADGLWFEGENYHFFALRGFVFAAELLRAAGLELYAVPETGVPLTAMFIAPLETLLPDLTLPARGDAPFGVSVRQPRFAELWELGFARTGDARVAGLLSELYDADLPPVSDEGIAAIAEQEDNISPARLERHRLGWKALLWMRPERPPAPRDAWRGSSCLLPAAGIAVLRPDAERYISVECGGRPGGHGHPDLLHLSVYWSGSVLLDFGTGSYVTPSLHWYRSTLAHNAPGRADVGQLERHGWCAAFDVTPGWSWCRATATDLFGAGTESVRTVVVGPRYVLDVVDVRVPPDVPIDLPLHPLGGVAAFEGRRLERTRDDAIDADAVEAVTELDCGPRRLALNAGDPPLELVTMPRAGERWLVASAPGPPDPWLADGSPLGFTVRRALGPGRWTQVYAPIGTVAEVTEESEETITVRLADGGHDVVWGGVDRWHVTTAAGQTIALSGGRPAPARRLQADPQPPTIRGARLAGAPTPQDWHRRVPSEAVYVLDGRHYRQSEQRYGAAGPFRARVAVAVIGTRLCFLADVEKSDPCGPRLPGPVLDNEADDIHADGLQVYEGSDVWGGYVVVPDPGGEGVRVRGVRGTAADPSRVTGTWRRTERGYAVVVCVETGRAWQRGDRVPVALVINEMYPDRQRRAGQLVLGGRPGWVYLRGDRESPRDGVHVEVA